MTGIKCHKCSAKVSEEATTGRLAADGIRWLAKTVIAIGRILKGPGFSEAAGESAPGKTTSFNCKACSEEMNDDFFRDWVPC
jgi:DNA-directed RNA polymerase subunit RPC12/RpoP